MIVCPSIAAIQRATSEHFGFPMTYLLSRRRKRDMVHARWVAMYLARELTLKTFPQIAIAFKRDHTTVLHGCAQLEREKYKHLLRDAEAIKLQLSRAPHAGLLACLT